MQITLCEVILARVLVMSVTAHCHSAIIKPVPPGVNTGARMPSDNLMPFIAQTSIVTR
jgi:hypothetical protein